MRYLLLLFFGLLLRPAGAQQAQTLTDLAYGPDSLQKMDVYLVANRTTQTPLVILVHGGGWMNGDKTACHFMRDFLLPQGINIVNINYRLATPQRHYREIMADMDSVLSVLVRKAEDWGIRKDQYVFWGGSAGGHLALLYAYKYDRRNVISAVTSLGGPTCLDDLRTLSKVKPSDLQGLLPLITGDPWTPPHLPAGYREASPCHGPDYKPTLLMHGGADPIVPVGQSEIMYRLLQERQIPSELIVLPNGGHGGEGTTPEAAQHMARTLVRWIQTYSR